MKRRWFLVLGVGTIVANLGFLVVFRSAVLENPATAVTNVIFVPVGVLLALGGADARPQNGEWYQFVGAGNVLLGVGMAAAFLSPTVNGTSAYDGSTGIVLAVCAAVGGASLVFIGFDWMCGGRYFDLSAYEGGPIFGLWSE